MENLGVKDVNEDYFGDLYVKVLINIPKNLNKEQKEKLIEFSKSLGENIKDKSFLGKVFR